MRTLEKVILLSSLAFTCAASAADPVTVLYNFEAPQFSVSETAPLLNRAPNVGLSTFRANFLPTYNNGTFSISPTLAVNPSFTGQILLGNGFNTNTLTISLSQAVTDVALDFAVYAPGYLVLRSGSGSATGMTVNGGQGGSLVFHSNTGITQFELLGFLSTGQASPLAIDNLSMTVVPEPGAILLFLPALGCWWLTRRSRTTS